jgi:hypothetical protein
MFAYFCVFGHAFVLIAQQQDNGHRFRSGFNPEPTECFNGRLTNVPGAEKQYVGRLVVFVETLKESIGIACYQHTIAAFLE